MKEKKKKKTTLVLPKSAKIAVIIASTIAVVGIISMCVILVLMINTPKDDLKEGGTEQEKYSIVIYESTGGYLCYEESEYCNTKVGEIKTKTPDAKILATDVIWETQELLYVLYHDEDVYLYDYKEKTKEQVDVEYMNDQEMYYNIASKDGKAKSIVYYRDNSYTNGEKISGYYDVKSKKTLYKNEYDALSTTEYDDYIQATNLKEYDAEEHYRETEYFEYIELSTNKKYFRIENTASACAGFYIDEYDGKKIYTIPIGCTSHYGTFVYNDRKEEIGPKGTDLNDVSNGNMYFTNENSVTKYNIKEETYKVVGTYENLLDVIYGHIIYIKNNKVYINDQTTDTYLFNWQSKYYYHSALSGYFKKENMASEVDKDEGIYMTFEYDGYNEGPGVEYYFNPETKEIKKYELEHIGGYAKPVLYLYPEKTTKVTVNFEKEDNLTTTYPKFVDEWEVTVNPNGDMYDKNGKYYYGLYWEEDLNHKVDFSEGFYVSKDNAIDFLEEKLSYIGLNGKERNEFIMYWLPIIEKNEHNLIYFELTEERDNFNKLLIEPKPDSMLRVAIHVKKVDGYQTIKEQKLDKFERKGFAAIEWGGISYN